MKLGKRLASLVISDIRSMSRACDAVGGINLGQGICDLPTPPPVADAARDAITDNRVVYTAADGILPLREAVRDKIRRHYGMEYDPSSEVVVTSGATGGFAAACLALFDPGDEIILFEPYYGYHLNTVIAFGLSPVLVPTRPPGWEVDFDALARAITPRTRAVVVCTPVEPERQGVERRRARPPRGALRGARPARDHRRDLRAHPLRRARARARSRPAAARASAR